jgi:hypothetical protein
MHLLDPDYLPKTVSTLDRFVLNPTADIDGLLLDDGTEIHTPPHLSDKLLKALSAGDSLTVHGVKTRASNLIVAVAIDPANGKRILDEGPGPKHDKHDKPKKTAEHGETATVSGMIHRLLHGPKGNAHGALLEDGTIVRFAPHCAEAFAKVLVVGATLFVRGHELSTKHGSVVNAKAMGQSEASLTDVPKPPKHDHPKHGGPEHGDKKLGKDRAHKEHGARH